MLPSPLSVKEQVPSYADAEIEAEALTKTYEDRGSMVLLAVSAAKTVLEKANNNKNNNTNFFILLIEPLDSKI